MVVQWLLFWLLLAQLLNYTITGKLYALFYQSETLTDLQSAQRNAILITLVTVELLTVGVAVSLHTIYPALVRWSVLNVMRWWDVRPGRRNNTLTYRPSPILHTKKRHSIVHSGGLNAKGQPHGYGMWTDTACNGEQLTGQWKDGIPIGPFRSFEHGSGYCFVNLRIGYCHNRAESRSDTTFHVPKHSPDGLHWGVASVECSVSGGFFRFLPGVSHLTPFDGGAEEPQNAAEVLPFLRTPADNMGFRPRVERTCSSLESVSLRCAARDKEALVFLHGFNCPLDYSLSRLAQLLALGDFPSHIHPFVFSWPSGSPLSYFQGTRARVPHSPIVWAEPLRNPQRRQPAPTAKRRPTISSCSWKAWEMLDTRTSTSSRIPWGRASTLVLCSVESSMPFSRYENSANPIVATHLIILYQSQSVRTDSEHPQARMQLCTLIFCNPDYSRDEFVKYGGAYDQSSRFCRHITLYADNLDGALFYAEIFSKRTVFGPLEYSLGRRGYTIHRDTQDQSEDQDLVAMQECNISHPVALDVAVVLVNQQRQFDGVKFFAYNDESEEVVESSSCTGQDRAAVYLDMDVIDATWMDNNVHSIRHNYFNLNPTLVR